MDRISLSAALNELEDMFPQYNREMLEEVIRQYNGKMDDILSFLLLISSDEPSLGEMIHTQTIGSSTSSQSQNEIWRIEEEYGLNLHRQWKVRLPADLLMFEIPETNDDEELARRLQNEFDEQASQSVLRSALNDTPYYSVSQRSIQRQPSYQNQPQESSVVQAISEKSKKWKNKFMNFFYERKGYKRVSVNDDSEKDGETELPNM